MEQLFYVCKHCGNMVGMLFASGVPMVCCGENMTKLEPNTSDGSGEKHVPAVERKGNYLTVKVGSVEHPMIEKHYIMWVYVQTEKGGIRHIFKPNEKPEWTFCVDNDKPVAVFEYCNLHGLWKVTL